MRAPTNAMLAFCCVLLALAVILLAREAGQAEDRLDHLEQTP